jgi:hypothetical protein
MIEHGILEPNHLVACRPGIGTGHRGIGRSRSARRQGSYGYQPSDRDRERLRIVRRSSESRIAHCDVTVQVPLAGKTLQSAATTVICGEEASLGVAFHCREVVSTSSPFRSVRSFEPAVCAGPAAFASWASMIIPLISPAASGPSSPISLINMAKDVNDRHAVWSSSVGVSRTAVVGLVRGTRFRMVVLVVRWLATVLALFVGGELDDALVPPHAAAAATRMKTMIALPVNWRVLPSRFGHAVASGLIGPHGARRDRPASEPPMRTKRTVPEQWLSSRLGNDQSQVQDATGRPHRLRTTTNPATATTDTSSATAGWVFRDRNLTPDELPLTAHTSGTKT